MSQNQDVNQALDTARELTFENDTSGYEYVTHTSKKTGKTITLEVRPISLKDDAESDRAATTRRPDGRGGFTSSVDPHKKSMLTLIRCVYLPNTDERVYSDADLDGLLTRRLHRDSLVLKLAEAVKKASSVQSLDDAKGNSDASLTSASS